MKNNNSENGRRMSLKLEKRVLLTIVMFLIITNSVFAVQYINTINGANQSIGNNNEIFIDNNNDRVGIGTTSPGTKLDVYDRARAGISYRTTIYGDGGGSYVYFGSASDEDSLGIISTSASTMFIDTYNGPLILKESGSEKVRLTSGNLGIGTTSPGAKLHIGGTDYTASSLTEVWNNPHVRIRVSSTTYNSTLLITDVSPGIVPAIQSATSASNTRPLALNPYGGNVGIATGSPGQTLTVSGTANITGATYLGNTLCSAGQVLTTNSATGLVSCTSVGSAAATVGGSGSSGYIALWNGTSTINSSMIYQGASGIGIGTTNPTQKLQIGTLASTSTATPDTITLGATYSNSAGTNIKLRVYDDGSSVGGLGVSANQIDYKVWGSTADHVFYQGTTELMRLKGTGNLGVGTSTIPEKLTVNGNVSGTIFYDADNKNYYVNPAGTTSALLAGNVGIGTTSPQSQLSMTGSSDILQSGFRHYKNVLHYEYSTSAVYGTMKITMPKNWSNTMMVVRIVGYDYSSNGQWEVVVSGYNYQPTATWVNYKAEIRGRAPFSQVRLANNGTYNLILLGTTATVWSYPKFVITDFIAGHSNVDGWGTGWSAVNTTSETGIINIATPTIDYYTDTSGRFGIGTTSPSSTLEVNGNVELTNLYDNDGSTFFDGGACTYGISNIDSTGAFTCASQQGTGNGNIGGSGSSGYITMWNGTSTINNSMIYQGGSGVGIGTTTVGYKLHVNGDIGGGSIYPSESASNAYIDASSSGIQIRGQAGTIGAYIYDTSQWLTGTTSLNRAGSGCSYGVCLGGIVNAESNLYAAGNVGIGTTSPLGALHIYNDTSNALRIGASQVSVIGETDDSGYPGMKINPYSGNVHLGISSTSNTNLSIWNSGTSFLKLGMMGNNAFMTAHSTNDLYLQTGGGKVGIGTTTVGQELHVNGDILISSGNWYYGRNAGGTDQPLIRSRGAGYDQSGYPGVQVGQTGDHIALFVDPASITGGSFNGNYNEIFLPNNIRFLQANDAGTNWLYTGGGTMVLHNGSVGIGTSAPAQTLTVSGTANITGATYLGNSKCSSGYVLSTDSSTGLVSCTAVSSIPGIGNVYGSGSSGYIALWNGTGTINSSIIYQTGGNIGIGTTTPGSYKLYVNGADTYLSNDLVVDGGDITNGNVAIDIGEASTLGALFTETTDNGYFEFTCADSGGNDLCEFKTGIYNNGGTFYNQNGLIQRAAISNDGATYLQINGGTSGYTYFNGYVGIGTSAPDSSLTIVGASGGMTNFSIYDAAGTVAGFQIRYDDNTGATYLDNRYDNAAGDIYIRTKTAGTAVNGIFIESAGNVGIGTTNPSSSKLQLVASGSGITQEKTTGGYFYSTGFNGNDPYLTYYAGAGMIIGYGSSTGGVPTVNTLTLLNGGNVGIGTTVPAQLLTVAGTANITGATYLGNTKCAANQALTTDATTGLISCTTVASSGVGGSGSSGYVALWNGTSTINNSMIYQGASGVGIGTTVPSAKLDIAAASAGTDELKIANNNAYEIKFSGTDAVNIYQSQASQDMYISTNGGKLYLGSSTDANHLAISLGNVGIGTSSPNAKLDVKGNVSLNNTLYVKESGIVGIGATNPGDLLYIYSATDHASLRIAAPSSGKEAKIVFDNNLGSWQIGAQASSAKFQIFDGYGTTGLILEAEDQTLSSGGIARIYVKNGGNIGIGTDTPGAKLDVKGNVSLNNTLYVMESGNVGINTTSPDFKLDIAGNARVENNNKLFFGGNTTTTPNASIYWDGSSLVIQVS